MNIDDMPAGREMDALVAEKVMGLVPCRAESHTEGHPLYMPRPCHAQPDSPDMGGETAMYSTSISDAWEVVEKMKKPNTRIEIQMPFGDHHWICWISDIKIGIIGGAGADSAPLAICRAALKASGQ